MEKTKIPILFLTQAAIIAALYAVLTLVLWTFSSLGIQVRVSEALCVLPLFTNAAVPGLFIGCAVANLIAGNVIDAIFGGMATLVAAGLTYLIGRKLKGNARLLLAPLPAVVINALVIPFVIYFAYNETEMLGFTEPWAVLGLLALSLFIGQGIACYGIGIPLTLALQRITKRFNIFEPDNYRRRAEKKGEESHDEMQ